MTDVCNYDDDTTFHAIEWFELNYVLLNQDKCHFLFSGHKYETLFVNVGETKISESKQ